MLCRLLIFALFLPVISHTQTYSSSEVLDEFVLIEKLPIKITADTISYTVDSFLRYPNATTEDALKHLSGVEISEGKIIIQGKEVKKVFLNGKEYNSSDINSLTQNLPAAILDKIEFADWVDEASQFTGVLTERNEKVMHLRFKKQYQQGATGKIAAGYGSKERYQSSLFANYMGDVFRLTATGNLNNTGLSSAQSQVSTSRGGVGSPGISERKNLGLNFSFDPSERLSLTGSYTFNENENMLESSVLRSTFLPNDSLLNNMSTSSSSKDNLNHNLQLRSVYKISKTTQLRTTLDASLGKQTDNQTGNDVSYLNSFPEAAKDFNFQRLRQQESKTASRWLAINNNCLHQFHKKGRSVTASVDFRFSSNTTDATILTENEYQNINQNSSVNSYSSTNFENRNTSLNLQYTEPVAQNSLVIASYGFSAITEQSYRSVTAEENGNAFFDSLQSRNFKNNNLEHRGGVFYQYQFNRFSAKAGGEVQQFSRVSERSSKEGSNITQNGVNYFPSVNASYQISKTARLSFDYRGTVQTPTIAQLQPIADYTDSLNIYTGNPDLLPEQRSSVSISFNDVNGKTKNMLWFRLGYNFTKRQIINKTEITTSKRVTTPVNVDGAYNVNATAGYTFHLIPKFLRATLGFQAGYNQNLSFLNGALRVLDNYHIAPSLRLQVISLKWLESSLNYSFRYNNTMSSVLVNNTVITHSITYDGLVLFPGEVRLGGFLKYVMNSGYASTVNRDFFVANLFIEKKMIKSKPLFLSIQGYDVFNQHPTIERRVGDNFIEDRSYSRLGSYWMTIVSYRFSYFPEMTPGK